MYHISNDKRAIQSSELIYNGLLECIKKKAFDQITISDLQKTSGVARSTFYRAFDNISDVLYWKGDTCFYEVLGNYHPQLFQGEIDFRYTYLHHELGTVLFHAHCLRHTHGTILAEGGVNPKTVMERLGTKIFLLLYKLILSIQKPCSKRQLNI